MVGAKSRRARNAACASRAPPLPHLPSPRMSGKLKPDVQSLGYSPANPTRRTIAKFGKVWASYCLFTFGLLLYLSLPYTFNHRRNATPSRNPAYLIKAENGVVASENIVCSEIGVNVLKDGKQAVICCNNNINVC